MADRADILVVEDDPDLMHLVADVLAGEGFAVRTASDGLQALAEIDARGMPELIVLDMRMPRMDGTEFARELERRHAAPAPLLVMTAAVDAHRRAAQVKASAWLEKPFDVEQMIATVRRVLASRPPAPTDPTPTPLRPSW